MVQADGTVLLSGGLDKEACTRDPDAPSDSRIGCIQYPGQWIFDPESRSFETRDLWAAGYQRAVLALEPLPDGPLVFAGGRGFEEFPANDVEAFHMMPQRTFGIWNPTWNHFNTEALAHARFAPGLAALDDQTVIVFGGVGAEPDPIEPRFTLSVPLHDGCSNTPYE